MSNESDEASSIDPMDLYPLDEVSSILGSIADHVLDELKSEVASLQDTRPTRRSGPRTFIDRPYAESEQGLRNDYFVDDPLYNETLFRRRFRMKRPLFLRIVEALGEWGNYFTLRTDALHRPGLSPLKKCTAAIRQLGNGSPPDQLDEYLKIGESTAVKCLKMFVKGAIEVYGEEYLRRSTTQDVECLVKIGEQRGFPSMLGSIDCMHWHWKKCPVGWKGMYSHGDQGVPMVILEAVASHDRWIWHAFFGVAGSNNDINVLNQSPLFVQQLRGEAPQVQYHVNGRQYNNGDYLADGIYLEWAAFVKSIREPQSERHKLFAKHQEGERKDVECAFGILQSHFTSLKRPARLWDQGDLENVMLACIILHNMVIQDEKDIDQTIPLDLNETTSTAIVQEATISQGQNPEMAEVIQRNTIIRDLTAHRQL